MGNAMSPLGSKILAAAAAVSVVVLALTDTAYPRPAPRDTETVRGDAQRAAQLRHARDIRNAALRQQAQRPALTAHASLGPQPRGQRPMFGWPALVTEARKYVGTNPTAMNRRWCARFMNMVLSKSGYNGTNSDAARSFASYGRRVSEPQIGAIAVLSRGNNRNLGHVGVVSGVDANGNPVIISGNHGRRVAESTYPRARVIAYVMPLDRSGGTQLASAGPISVRSDAGELTSPIDELLAAINAEPDRRAVPQPVPPPQQVAQPVRAQLAARAPAAPAALARIIQQTAVPLPHAAPMRLASLNIPLPRPAPQLDAVPMPRVAPYRIVQQTPTPIADPRIVR
jgi:uncharacterized protein (TIGR02594 family)